MIESKVQIQKDDKTLEVTNPQLVSAGMAVEQILHITQKTPLSHVYTRPAKGGGTWDYVTGVYVKKVLNYAFGWLWSFEIKDKGREGDLVWVLGKLTVELPNGKKIVKEQFGRADIKMKKGTQNPLDYGNDLKSASTDALKKCASELGIASDIYGKNEFKEIKMIEVESQEMSEEDQELIKNCKTMEELSKACSELQKKYKYSLIAPLYDQVKASLLKKV